MKNAVIYPRYSSQGQNEQSIEGQIRICTEFAESNGYNIVGIYPDKARTGTNDSRPAFQRMIKDAASGKFQYIIVYMFDRFARNRRDSIMYKEMLKQEYGVRVISATQPISDDEGGEFYEMFLEWNDEKYSKRLSKRVRNGLDTSVANGTFCGGHLVYGYKLRQEPTASVGRRNRFTKFVEIDEEQAEIIRYIFTEYDKGVEKQDIAAALNARGARFGGKPFKGRTFDKWLTNAKYTGEFTFGGRLCNNTYPAIIDKALFERVQKRLAKNRYFAGGTATARVPYLLTGKAFCAKCETPMIADGGTSRTGQQHHYYICKGRKKGVCKKHRDDKDELELFVTQVVYDFLSDEKNVKLAVKDTIAYYERRTGIDNLKNIDGKIAKVQRDIDEMTTAFIEAKNALLRANIEKRMNDYEKLIEDLKSQKEQLERERGNQFTEKDILEFVADLLQGNPADKDYQKKLIDNLVVKVFVDDGYATVHIKLGNATEVADIRLKEVKKALEHLFNSVQTLSPLARHKKRTANRQSFFCDAEGAEPRAKRKQPVRLSRLPAVRAVCFAVLAGRNAHIRFENVVEVAERVVPDERGDGQRGVIAVLQQVARVHDSQFCDVLHGRNAEIFFEGGDQHGRRIVALFVQVGDAVSHPGGRVQFRKQRFQPGRISPFGRRKIAVE